MASTSTVVREPARKHRRLMLPALAALGLAACGGGGTDGADRQAQALSAGRSADKPIALVPLGANVVSDWHAIAITLCVCERVGARA